ncbi:MAG: cellulase family glycosylhydrolase [Chitinispirillales bacterium]|jgi:endoglucanase|nr:cellulase family glycosylhydrolase [Chitinispirillales bacterium]
MKKVLSIAVIAVLAGAGVFLAEAQQPPAGSPVAQHGQLRVVGNQIVGVHNNPVQLRGMSLYWSLTDGARTFYNAATVQRLRSDWQADVVRAAMAVERNFANQAVQQGFILQPDANRNLVLAVVDEAIEQGIYVIIDWHSYAAELHQAQAVAFFQDMARRYGNTPNVIFEIYNEPNGIRQEGFTAQQNGGLAIPTNRNTPWSTIRDYMQAVTNAIRAEGANNIILIGTPNWCQDTHIATANPVIGENLAYTAHFYAGQNDPVHRGRLRNRILTAMDRGFAVFISEFGLTNASGAGALDLVETDRWFDFLDYHHIGWANWALSSHNQTSAALQSGSSGDNPSGWQLSPSGTHVRNRLRSPRSTTMPFRILRLRDSESDDPNVEHFVSASGSTDDGANVHVFDHNANVTITAFPHFTNPPTWRFVRWEGDVQGLTGLDQTTITVPMNANRTITAIFERLTVSTLPLSHSPVIRWSVARSGNHLVLSGPSAAEATLYDMRGKRVSRFTYDGGGRAMNIGGRNIPAGHYMLVVRDIATNREVFRDRVTMVR